MCPLALLERKTGICHVWRPVLII